jgi:hypothetical protein
MLKKLPLKKIIIVSSAMLVIPIMAFAMTIIANPSDGTNSENSHIKIISSENASDAVSSATGLVQSSHTNTTEAVSYATGNADTTRSNTDAVNSATSKPGATGSIDDGDNQYEDDEDDEDDD